MQKKYKEIEKSISTELEPIYLFYGEEEYLISTLINKIKKRFGELVLGINYILIDDTNIDELISNVEIPAFGYDKKLIIVKNSNIFKKDGRKKKNSALEEKLINYFNDNFEIVKDSCVIIFNEIEVNSSELFNVIENKSISFKSDYLDIKSLVAYLKNICSLYHVNVEEKALVYLVENCGTNLRVLINELRKVIEYTGEGNTIEIDTIDKLCIKQIESVIFDLTDNIGAKKISKAIEILDNLISNKEPLQVILVTLYTHFKRLYICKISQATTNKEALIAALGIRPNHTFLIKKYQGQSKNFTQKTLRELIEALADLDYNSKIGNIDIDVGLRSILCNYCS